MKSATETNALGQGSTASRAAASRVQAKLSVSRGHDSYEQEADRVASVVVGGAPGSRAGAAAPSGVQRLPEPGPVAARVAPAISRLVARSPLPSLQTQEEGEPQAAVQRAEENQEPQGFAQRQEEEEEAQTKEERHREEEKKEKPQKKVQLQSEEKNEPQALVQRQEEKDEAQSKAEQHGEEEKKERPQKKLQLQSEEKNEPQPLAQRQEEEKQQAQTRADSEREPQTKLQRQEEEEAQTKAEPRPNVRDKRMFPEVDRVEKKLFETKGKGEPLPEQARIDMETGFGADFRQVRIHTAADAVEMNRELKAQAFTHGRDVFFNSGKYEPDTVRGKTLLAHELTHVVQQQAAEQKIPESRVAQHNAARTQPPPEPADKQARATESKVEERIAQHEAEATKKSGVPAAVPPTTTAATGAAPAPEAAVPASAAPASAAAEPSAPGPPAAEAEKGAAAPETAEKPPAKAEPEAKAEIGGGARRGREAAAEAAPEAAAATGAKAAGVVGEFLRRSTKAVFEGKKAGVHRLAKAQSKKEPADTKLAQTEKAVEPPAQEAQSRANAGQVATVDKAKAPAPDEGQAKSKFNEALNQAVPTTLEEVDKFKEAGRGRVVGQAVREVVTADTQEVKGTYQEIENTPAAGAPEEKPEDLPDVEAAPETPAVAMGEGVVGEVQPEHSDMSEFGNQSDQLLEKEQIKEEHLEMVDEGDLAEAKQDRQTVKTKVREGPAEVKQVEHEEKQKVSKDLQKEEQEGKQLMQGERRKELHGARDDQKKTKSKLELQRQAVTDRINGIYEKANTTVKQKLDDLEKKSLAAFDEGQKQATQTFENNVKRRMDAFKARRYDRLGGGLLWAKDKLFGMDDLPEVKEIFDSEKAHFVTAIDELIKTITADNKRVIQECKDIVANARKEIEKFVQGLGPELKKTGKEALKDMRGKLDALDQKINAKEEELKQKLAQKREAAIKAIEEKIAKMKEEMSGLVSKLGKLLLEAMVKFFKWALKKAGYASDQLMGIINKGKEVIQKIVTDPIGFIKNLVKAVRDGIDLFWTNIKKHLMAGLMNWLTGAMSDVPITFPDKWDLKGILFFILQILGLTWNMIRAKLVKRLGEKVVRIAETAVDIVKRLISEGPMGLWEMLKEKAEEIKQQVIEGIRNWAMFELVKQAIIKLVSFLNPAGAIVQAILAIYNTIMFFVENWERIVDFVKTVFNSIGDIAMGKLSAAAQAVERALGMTVSIILSFLARLLGLSGIGKTITAILKKIRKPIDKVVNKVIDVVVRMAKKLVGKVKAGAKALKEKGLALIKWWRKRFSFRDKSGNAHALYYSGSSKSAKLMVASPAATEVGKFLRQKKREVASAQGGSFTFSDVQDAETFYLQKVKKKEEELGLLDKASAKEKQTKAVNENRKLVQELEALHAQLAPKLVKLISPDAGEYPPPKLPVMADNKKASSFTADYIVKAGGNFKHGVSTGSESGAHVGNLEGWPQLQGAKLTNDSQWVRMHLLPHRLGGNAVDSNLTPARGPRSNVPFSHALEQPAIETAMDAPPKTRKPIWYKFQIQYHSGKHKPFPSLLRGEFGTYDKAAGEWKRGPAVKAFSQTPTPPDFVPTIPDLNALDVAPAQIKAASGVDLGFVELILNVRDGIPGRRFSSALNFKLSMDQRYVGKDADGKPYYRFGVENYPARLGMVMAALAKGGIVLK